MSLIEWLDVDDVRPVVVADPNAGTRRFVVDEDPPDIGELPRQQVVDEASILRVEAREAIVEHRARPDLAVLVGFRVVRIGPRRRWLMRRELLGVRIEHADMAAAESGEPQPVLAVDATAARLALAERHGPDPGHAGV